MQEEIEATKQHTRESLARVEVQKIKERKWKAKQEVAEAQVQRLKEEVEKAMAVFRAMAAASARAEEPSTPNDEVSPPAQSPVTFSGLLSEVATKGSTKEELEMIVLALAPSVPPAWNGMVIADSMQKWRGPAEGPSWKRQGAMKEEKWEGTDFLGFRRPPDKADIIGATPGTDVQGFRRPPDLEAMEVRPRKRLTGGVAAGTDEKWFQKPPNVMEAAVGNELKGLVFAGTEVRNLFRKPPDLLAAAVRDGVQGSVYVDGGTVLLDVSQRVRRSMKLKLGMIKKRQA